MTKKGIIFNIQRFTIHDGPGIRTELFLKGCPLACRWCGNPESQSESIVPGVYASKCLGADKCGFCESACPSPGSLIFKDNRLVSIDRGKCVNCMECGGQCPADAIKQWGKAMTVDEAMDVILRDADYYRSSQGGVTVSGGEPLLQSEFVTELFRRCHGEQIHTCLESTLCTDWSMIERILAHTDLVITDIKHMDAQVHMRHTGISNINILKNLKKLSEQKTDLIIRIPVIPGVNDDWKNIEATCDFILDELGNRIVLLQLLAFMRLGEEKYASLGKPYPMSGMNLDRNQFQRHMEELATYFNGRGVNCIIGTTAKEDGGK